MREKVWNIFIFTHIFTVSGALHFFLWIRITLGCHFLLTWRTCISISYKITLLAILSSVCIYLEASLFFLHFLKDSFAEYRIPGWSFFSLSTLTIHFEHHCFWCSWFPTKSQLIIFFGMQWIVFSLVVIKIFLKNMFSLSLESWP